MVQIREFHRTAPHRTAPKSLRVFSLASTRLSNAEQYSWLRVIGYKINMDADITIFELVLSTIVYLLCYYNILPSTIIEPLTVIALCCY